MSVPPADLAQIIALTAGGDPLAAVAPSLTDLLRSLGGGMIQADVRALTGNDASKTAIVVFGKLLPVKLPDDILPGDRLSLGVSDGPNGIELKILKVERPTDAAAAAERRMERSLLKLLSELSDGRPVKDLLKSAFNTEPLRISLATLDISPPSEEQILQLLTELVPANDLAAKSPDELAAALLRPRSAPVAELLKSLGNQAATVPLEVQRAAQEAVKSLQQLVAKILEQSPSADGFKPQTPAVLGPQQLPQLEPVKAESTPAVDRLVKILQVFSTLRLPAERPPGFPKFVEDQLLSLKPMENELRSFVSAIPLSAERSLLNPLLEGVERALAEQTGKNEGAKELLASFRRGVETAIRSLEPHISPELRAVAEDILKIDLPTLPRAAADPIRELQERIKAILVAPLPGQDGEESTAVEPRRALERFVALLREHGATERSAADAEARLLRLVNLQSAALDRPGRPLQRAAAEAAVIDPRADLLRLVEHLDDSLEATDTEQRRSFLALLSDFKQVIIRRPEDSADRPERAVLKVALSDLHARLREVFPVGDPSKAAPVDDVPLSRAVRILDSQVAALLETSELEPPDLPAATSSSLQIFVPGREALHTLLKSLGTAEDSLRRSIELERRVLTVVREVKHTLTATNGSPELPEPARRALIEQLDAVRELMRPQNGERSADLLSKPYRIALESLEQQLKPLVEGDFRATITRVQETLKVLSLELKKLDMPAAAELAELSDALILDLGRAANETEAAEILRAGMKKLEEIISFDRKTLQPLLLNEALRAAAPELRDLIERFREQLSASLARFSAPVPSHPGAGPDLTSGPTAPSLLPPFPPASSGDTAQVRNEPSPGRPTDRGGDTASAERVRERTNAAQDRPPARAEPSPANTPGRNHSPLPEVADRAALERGSSGPRTEENRSVQHPAASSVPRTLEQRALERGLLELFDAASTRRSVPAATPSVTHLRNEAPQPVSDHSVSQHRSPQLEQVVNTLRKLEQLRPERPGAAEEKLFALVKEAVRTAEDGRTLRSEDDVREFARSTVETLQRTLMDTARRPSAVDPMNGFRDAMRGLENIVRGQEALQQMTPLFQALGEPTFLLFPHLVQGLLSRIELAYYPHQPVPPKERPRPDGELENGGDELISDGDEKRRRKSFERVRFRLTLPALGELEVDFAHTLTEMILTVACADSEARSFLEESLPMLEASLRALGYSTLSLRASARAVEDIRPAWVDGLMEASLARV